MADSFAPLVIVGFSAERLVVAGSQTLCLLHGRGIRRGFKRGFQV